MWDKFEPKVVISLCRVEDHVSVKRKASYALIETKIDAGDVTVTRWSSFKPAASKFSLWV